MSKSEHTIPEIEVGKDWYVSELADSFDCDDAITYLNEAINVIEHQLSLHKSGVKKRTPEWEANSTLALAFKRQSREAVFRKRAVLVRQERRATEWLAINYPDLWANALAETKGGEGGKTKTQ